MATLDTTSQPAPGEAAAVDKEVRFPVEVAGFSGSLEQLLIRAQRGEIDVTAIPVSEITAQYRQGLGDGAHDLRDNADFLALAARLVALKAARLLPENREVAEAEAEEVSELGQRLADYRLYKAAADALLAGPAEEGARSFLSMVSPEVIPVERLRIPPERLAAAFRAVLERLAANEPLPVGTVTFSVEEKVEILRARLGHGIIAFEEIFTDVGSRLEAVACFLALLELLKRGEAIVEQSGPFAPIQVSAAVRP